MPDFLTVTARDVAATPYAAGITVRRLYRSDDSATAQRALVVEFAPGARWPGDDVHLPGPEDVYVLSGTFEGLAGAGTVHHAGDFVHCVEGSAHAPSTETGGALFVYYPRG